jgi:hypothetical protein
MAKTVNFPGSEQRTYAGILPVAAEDRAEQIHDDWRGDSGCHRGVERDAHVHQECSPRVAFSFERSFLLLRVPRREFLIHD